ncbi:hypothetical protein EYF80_044291 [Liparis tanakae]|uniref:Uncharacterized protein n=1 Tax=Liparis tanakae TaxID=230148 RepID=A0A4Z2FW94_9TELE|nr:hypothetical protein EYF80_044291 [Liparis tanakae]
MDSVDHYGSKDCSRRGRGLLGCLDHVLQGRPPEPTRPVKRCRERQSKTSPSAEDRRRDSPWCRVKKAPGFSPLCSTASRRRAGGSR